MFNPELVGALIGLARVTDGNEHLINPSATAIMIECLQTDDLISESQLHDLLSRLDSEKRYMVPDCYLCANPCGKHDPFDMELLKNEPVEICNMKYEILEALRVFACKGNITDNASVTLLYQSLILIGIDGVPIETLKAHRAQLDC